MGSVHEQAISPGPFDVKSVAIIGAGPSGLAAAKHLLAQRRRPTESEGGSGDAELPAFPRIVVFEQQAQVGGVWHYSARPTETRHIPQTSAFCPPDPPILAADGGAPVPVFPSPMYDSLHTNIPHTLMRYSDAAFAAPDDDDPPPLFPERQDVQAYLEEYARDVRHLIRFSTQVVDVSPLPREHRQPGGSEQAPPGWQVRSLDLLLAAKGDGSGNAPPGNATAATAATATSQKAELTETFDAVVVASGHYSVPYVPDIPGIREFDSAYPGALSHSKAYRSPAVFAGRNVLVVGNSASGLDIASQVRAAPCLPPLRVSVRTPTSEEARRHVGFEEVAEIERFLIPEKGVLLKDGTTITGLDDVLFCTGYLFTFPFLEKLQQQQQQQQQQQRPGGGGGGGGEDDGGVGSLITDGRRVHGLYKHFLHIRYPTLVFPGLPIKVIPFPLAEAQAAVFARVWANELPLPSRADMYAWERKEAQLRGAKFHVFPKGGDGRYINAMHDWALAAAGGPPGKEPPWWGHELLWQRGIYAEAKMKFEDTGKKARTLEELGFHYEGPVGLH
ncbi:hypothetical protein BX600DRAFT_481319 [Xylariales sp. PMI_506]|nr:hypothetical protein BX600DRAFT_481319 [Xylariales sp. PMI_506]